MVLWADTLRFIFLTLRRPYEEYDDRGVLSDLVGEGLPNYPQSVGVDAWREFRVVGTMQPVTHLIQESGGKE